MRGRNSAPSDPLGQPTHRQTTARTEFHLIRDLLLTTFRTIHRHLGKHDFLDFKEEYGERLGYVPLRLGQKRREAQLMQKGERERAQREVHNLMERVANEAIEAIHPVDAVMNGVEPPQQRELMANIVE